MVLPWPLLPPLWQASPLPTADPPTSGQDVGQTWVDNRRSVPRPTYRGTYALEEGQTWRVLRSKHLDLMSHTF
eukprot:3331543-Rhodomonas_salina.1